MNVSSVVFVALFFAAGPLAGPALEREAREIETMLIAPCCWNQQVSEHQSAASDEVKKEIRVLLAAGRTRQEVLDAFVAQYGKRILAEPPAEGLGRFLYVIPWVVFGVSAVGLTWLIRHMSQHRPQPTPATAAAGLSQQVPPGDEGEYAQRLDDELRDLD